MFTGIIAETGFVQEIHPTKSGRRLVVVAGPITRGLKLGDSVAVNGCCLTVTRLTPARGKGKRTLTFDLLAETWQRTNLQFCAVGKSVNLERPLAAGGRLDGHFVTGHVDGLGTIVRWEPVGSDWVLEIRAAASLLRYIVQKGSIAIDGISLTVAGVERGKFRVWIIPHTYRATALRERAVGDPVNLEADILGKYVEKFLQTSRPARRRKK